MAKDISNYTDIPTLLEFDTMQYFFKIQNQKSCLTTGVWRKVFSRGMERAIFWNTLCWLKSAKHLSGVNNKAYRIWRFLFLNFKLSIGSLVHGPAVLKIMKMIISNVLGSKITDEVQSKRNLNRYEHISSHQLGTKNYTDSD